MADFLDEDQDIRNQKYCVFSYTLPDPKGDPKGKKRVGYDTPMIKIRGSYATTEECQARIEVLKRTDKYFHMYVASVGLWGPLLTEKQHEEIGTESEYMNQDMNAFMKDYKSQQDKKAEAFEERKNKLVEQAKQDGTKEGQALLAAKRENPVSIKDRIFKTQQQIKDLEDQLQEARDLHKKSVTLLETYTEEEILQAEEEFKKNSLKID
jgi:hypothetical protein